MSVVFLFAVLFITVLEKYCFGKRLTLRLNRIMQWNNNHKVNKLFDNIGKLQKVVFF